MHNFEEIAAQQNLYLSYLPLVRQQYSTIPGVEIIGLGAKERKGATTEEWAFRFYVKEKKSLKKLQPHEVIPPVLYGIQTDVISHFEKIELVCASTDRINDVGEYIDGGILGGSAIRNEHFGNDHASGYGTLGILARLVSTNQLVGLTCAHVVNAASDTMTTVLTKVGQPQYWVSCCCCPRGRIGEIITPPVHDANLDCAIILLDDDVRKKVHANDTAHPAEFPAGETRENKILGHVGTDAASVITIGVPRAIMCFETVKKRGQATGLTTGRVIDLAYGTNQMLVERTGGTPTSPFACHGDSGAVLLSTSNDVLGMVVAADRGNMRRTIVTHIKPIMQALNISINNVQFGTLTEPIDGGPDGCEVKLWPGGQTDTALNPAELLSATQFGHTGAANWDLTLGAPGAVIVEKDSVAIAPVTTVTGATTVKIKYNTVSSTANTPNAVQVKTTGSAGPRIKFRTIFKITPRAVNTSAALDADNAKRFLANNGNTAQSGIEFPGNGASTRYLAKAEIGYDILPVGITWAGANISFVTGNPAGTLGNVLAKRETKFCRGEQAVGAANRTHTDQVAWVTAGDSSADDFQAPSSEVATKLFRIANKGFNPAHEGSDINHDSFNPTNYLQRYVRAHYRDFLQFFDGTAWVRLTPHSEWSVNLTANLTVALPHTAPPTPGAAGDNIVELGLNVAPLPNTQPVIAAIATQEVSVGVGTTTLTAVVTDGHNDVFTVHWTRTDGTAVVLSGGGVGNPVTFTTPGADAPITFSVVARDNTQGLSRAPVPANFESVAVTAIVNVVETLVKVGGDPRLCLDDQENFNSANFHIGGGSVNWNVTGGGTNAVIIEANGNSIAPVGTFNGATTIRVAYNNTSANASRANTVIIRATDPADATRTFIKRRTVNARPAHVITTNVLPGAVPSSPVAGMAGVWGFTFPENITVTICAFRNGANWQAALLTATGNYSLQTRLLPGVVEVTGPGAAGPGTTTVGNYCTQMNDLDSLTWVQGSWFMISAVSAHENVHATRFLPGLNHVSVVTALQTAIDALTVPHVGGMTQAAAIAAIIASPAFAAALTTGQGNWLAQIIILVTNDHGPAGVFNRAAPTYVAELGVVNPMIATICAHRTANGWAACPPLCP
jgi:hypothetical protein